MGWEGSTAIWLLPAPSLSSKISKINLAMDALHVHAVEWQHSSRGYFKVSIVSIQEKSSIFEGLK